MPEDEQKDQVNVTLEDILRLKRQERPTAEFWDRFDRELRQKTLKALVDETPWHRKHLKFTWARFAAAVPVAASLAVALFFVLNREAVVEPAPADSFAGQTLDQSSSNAHVMAANTRPRSQGLPYYRSEMRVFINVVAVPASRPQNFEKVMTPQTLTASTDASAVYVSDPLGFDDSSVHFVSAPTLEYF